MSCVSCVCVCRVLCVCRVCRVWHEAGEYLEVEEADEEGEEQGLDEPSGDLQRVAELHDARTETEQAPSVEEVGPARDRNLRHVFIAIAMVVLLLHHLPLP